MTRVRIRDTKEQALNLLHSLDEEMQLARVVEVPTEEDYYPWRDV
jgi:hypothetical protein